MSVIGYCIRGMGRNVRLDFALPKTRRRLVAEPLHDYLCQNVGKKRVGADELSSQIWHLGIGAPQLAVKTIKKFEARQAEKNRVIPPEKEAVLSGLKRDLRRVGRLLTLCKLVLAACVYQLTSLLVTLIFVQLPPLPNFEHNPDFNVTEPAPLGLMVAGNEYTLYGGNAWNRRLREECADFFTLRDALTQEQLASCWQRQFGQPLSASPFPEYLARLDRLSIEVTSEMRSASAKIKQVVGQVPDLGLGVISTNLRDDAVRLWSESGKEEGLPPDYAQYYCEVYAAPQATIPPLLSEAEFFIVPGVAKRTTRLPDDFSLPLYQVIETNSRGQRTASYVPLKLGDDAIYFKNTELKSSYRLVKYFEPEINEAAAILYRHHASYLSYDQLRLILLYKIMHELAHLRFEDPWQDISASGWAGSKYAEKFKQVFQGVDYGVRIWDETWDLPWRLASFVHTSMEQQGFGPCQVIFGLFKQASADSRVREHFSGVFSAEVFEEGEAAMRAIFEQPVMSSAMLYDYVLTRLEQTVFSDPQVRRLPSLPPFLEREEISRQYALMETATILVGFPEFGIMPPLLFSWPDRQIGVWNFISDLFLGKPFLPEVEGRKKIFSVHGIKLMMYFGREKSQRQ